MVVKRLVRTLSSAPGGEFVVTSGADNTVRLWDATNGEAVRILATDAGAVGGIGFSPDGGMVVAPARRHGRSSIDD